MAHVCLTQSCETACPGKRQSLTLHSCMGQRPLGIFASPKQVSCRHFIIGKHVLLWLEEEFLVVEVGISGAAEKSDWGESLSKD